MSYDVGVARPYNYYHSSTPEGGLIYFNRVNIIDGYYMDCWLHARQRSFSHLVITVFTGPLKRTIKPMEYHSRWIQRLWEYIGFDVGLTNVYHCIGVRYCVNYDVSIPRSRYIDLYLEY